MLKQMTWLGVIATTLGLAAAPALACDEAKREAWRAARDAAMRQADADANGALDAAEFAVFLDTMHTQMAQLRFARLDADGNGQVSLEELETDRGRRRH